MSKLKPTTGVLTLGLGLLLMFSGQSQASSSMKRLYEELFSDYNRLILPVASNGSKVVVELGLKLGQILDLNLKQQILSTNVWVEQTWHDYKLTWDPNLYEGIEMVHVPAENIWIPDIVLFNNADGNYELTLVAKARVYYNGTVVWKPPTMFRSTCEIDVEYFPFDIQTCYLRFGSWTYAGDEVELVHVGRTKRVDYGIDLSQFYKNVEWDIIDVPAYRNVMYYDCCTEPYPDITFKIVIRRKILFYLVNLILPVALMTFMTVSVFYLPSDSNEKVTLSISILTSLIVFFLLMLEIIPASSLAVPLFGKYLLFTLVLVSLSACVSVYVLNIHHRSPAIHSMSPRTRQIFLKTLPKLLFLNQPDPRERSSLNRFRQKKIAQQLLSQASNSAATNKVYDLAQPMAASLNLIETLHKSYHFNPSDDNAKTADDQGRYFRQYVDDYIEQLKARAANQNGQTSTGSGQNAAAGRQPCPPGARSCEPQRPCCDQALRPRAPSSGYRVAPAAGPGWMVAQPACCSGAASLTQQQQQHARQQRAFVGLPSSRLPNLINDDTLDMTFDCDDDQQNPQTSQKLNELLMNPLKLASQHSLLHHRRALALDHEVPSPPPPPSHASRVGSSCSMRLPSHAGLGGHPQHQQQLSSEDDSQADTLGCEAVGCPLMAGATATGSAHLSRNQLSATPPSFSNASYVNKLISSIQVLDECPSDFDTPTTTATTSTSQAFGAQAFGLDEEREGLLCAGTSHLIDHVPMGGFGSNVLRNQQARLRLAYQPHPADTLGGQHSRRQPASFRDQCTSMPYTHSCQHSFSMSMSNQNQLATNTTPVINIQHDHQHPHPQQQEQHSQQPQAASELLLSLRKPYDQMPGHVRAAIRSILFIADTIKNEDDENSAIEDWESMSMVVDRLFLWIFFMICTLGSAIILAQAPSLSDKRMPIDDLYRTDISPGSCQK